MLEQCEFAVWEEQQTGMDTSAFMCLSELSYFPFLVITCRSCSHASDTTGNMDDNRFYDTEFFCLVFIFTP